MYSTGHTILQNYTRVKSAQYDGFTRRQHAKYMYTRVTRFYTQPYYTQI